MNSLLEGFKNIRISMAKTSKRLIPSSSSLKVAQGYESGPEGANLMRSTPTMMYPSTVIESKDDLVENKKEQTAGNILSILRKMDDSIFKKSSIIEKSTAEFKKFYKEHKNNFDIFAKRVLEEVKEGIDRNKEPNKYNFLLELISCKINPKACEDDVRDKPNSLSMSTRIGGKRKKITKKRRDRKEKWYKI